MTPVNISQKLARFSDHWNPRIVAELNGQHVKLVKFQGEFVWHHHAGEDEMFLVIQGEFRMDYRGESGEYSVPIHEGEFIIVPRGTEHRPVAANEVSVMLFEPAATHHTGNVTNERTVENQQWI
ncbi:MAG: cupin domain-containing protein [Bryobacteraceae bacterium]|nr:cupin domain-containing protein [Bryobacteraceae bacterium]